MIKLKIKRIISKLLFKQIFVKTILDHYKTNQFAILTYHRIIPIEKLGKYYQSSMYVDPFTFEMQMKVLNKYFKLVHLDEILSINKNMYKRPLCVITFDDGWKDNYEYAFPIIKKYKIPITIFLTTNYIGTSDWLWTDKLIYLFKRYKKRFIEFELNSLIEEFKNMNHDTIIEKMQNIEKEVGLRSYPKDTLFLNWEEIDIMSHSNYVQYGSHTSNHKILTTEINEVVINELINAKEVLIENKIVEPRNIPFCFPNGNYTDRIVSLVNKTGYKQAVTTDKGWNDFGSNQFKMKRISIHQDISTNREMFFSRLINLF